MTTYSDTILAPALAISSILKMESVRASVLRLDLHHLKIDPWNAARVDRIFTITEEVICIAWQLSGKNPLHSLDHTAKGKLRVAPNGELYRPRRRKGQ